MANYNIKNLKILVVEQNSLSAAALIKMLHELGVREVFAAASVDDGFKIFKNQQLDLVFSDWSPGVDGIRFLDMVRNDRMKTNPFIPVIILSAYSDTKQLTQAINAGINNFLSKPLSARGIYKQIKRTIEIPNFFVRSGHYFGPCRRHMTTNYRSSAAFEGQERRVRTIPMGDESLTYGSVGHLSH